MCVELPFVDMFVTSLKGVGSTDPSKEDAGGSLTLTVRAAADFFWCRDTPAFFSSDIRAYHPSLPVGAFLLS